MAPLCNGSVASSVVLVHNHPSGDPTPSPDDLHLTAEAIAAGRLLDIDVLAHVIAAGDAEAASSVHTDMRLELAWTLGPAFILLLIAIPTIRTIFREEPPAPPSNSLKVTVIAHQWWWEFRYPGTTIVTANDTIAVPQADKLEIAQKILEAAIASRRGQASLQPAG